MAEKVVVGLSGGVDSAAAAWLLKEQGYDVIGVTMQIWQDEPVQAAAPQDGEDRVSCGGLAAVEDARRVAETIGIPYHVMNFRSEFKRNVIDRFMAEYIAGRTPNPCVICNRYVKWEALLRRSRELGADRIATGHYAKVARTPDGRYALHAAKTAEKDQTYALYALTQDQLSRTLMPDGDHTKDEIRAIAERAGIPVAGKPDSQEICFVPDNDYAGFIERNAASVPPPGNFVTADGRILGKHRGITHYTVGQRKGLGLAMGHPVFVTEIRPETDEVVIGEAEDVFSSVLTADRLNWMAVDGLHGKELRCMAKIRYNHRGAPCTVRETEPGLVTAEFDSPQRAVTPGQALVLYSEDGYVLGGGTIL